jgi:hypothetical protein
VNKFLVALLTTGCFLISTQVVAAEAIVSSPTLKKEVISSNVPSQSPVKKRKPVKAKRKVTSISFDSAPIKASAKKQVKKTPKVKSHAQRDGKKNYRVIFCRDGYVVKNQAFCAIGEKAKVSAKQSGKNTKSIRSVASFKEKESKKSAKTSKK